jgi:hypothetical protein
MEPQAIGVVVVLLLIGVLVALRIRKRRRLMERLCPGRQNFGATLRAGGSR